MSFEGAVIGDEIDSENERKSTKKTGWGIIEGRNLQGVRWCI